VKYTKPALTYEEQADQLLRRGLVADREELLARLRSVSYYRLSGYWYPLRLPDDSFADGTTVEAVWRRYTFDRRLRLVVLDAIERVELRIRTDLVYTLAHAQGPFGYSDAANLPGLSPAKHEEFLANLRAECERSHEPFLAHFCSKYRPEHDLPPYWMVTELMTFGLVLMLFRGSPAAVKQDIARRLGVTDRVLASWLHTINAVRNICAHHGRLWNRELGMKPMIPKKDARWHDPVDVANNRVFGVLTILKYLLDEIAPQSGWSGRLMQLLAEYSDTPRESMGFPVDWSECPIWRGVGDSGK